MRGGGEGNVWRSGSGRIRWGWRIALFTLLFLGLLLTLNQVAAWLDAPWMSGEWDPRTWGWLTAVVSALAASWWMAEGVEDVPMAALGLPLDGGTAGELLRGTAVGVVLMGVAVAVLALAGWMSWGLEGSFAGFPGAFVEFAAFFLVAAFGEEVLLRGYPFQVMVEGAGPVAAIVVTSVVFSGLHGLNPEVGTMALVNLGLAGVLLAVAYWKTYSLWFATGLHFGWNWTMSFAADLPVSGLPMDTPGIEASVSGPRLWTGGAFGPEAGLVVTAVTLVGIAWLLWTDRVDRSLRILALDPIPERHRREDGAERAREGAAGREAARRERSKERKGSA